MGTRVTHLAYTDDKDNLVAFAVHKSADTLSKARPGTQAYDEAPHWTVHPEGPYGWERDHYSLPEPMRVQAQQGWPLEAETVEDAREALDRIGSALEIHLADRETIGQTLARRVAAAQAYGKVPELPLAEERNDTAPETAP